MFDIIRDAPLGQLCRLLSESSILRYADEEPNYRFSAFDGQADNERAHRQQEKQPDAPIIAGCHCKDDPDNPQNWSHFKRAVVAF